MGLIIKTVGSLMIIGAFTLIFGTMMLTSLPSADQMNQLGLLADQIEAK